MCGRRSLCNLITLAMILRCAVISEPMRGQVATPANEQKTTIHGVVINSVTHEPVGHALVFSADGRLGTLTDDQGRFEFVLPQTADASSREGSAVSEVTVSFTGNGPLGGWLNARKPGFLDPTDPFVSSLMTCFTKRPGTSFTLFALARPARRGYEVTSSGSLSASG